MRLHYWRPAEDFSIDSIRDANIRKAVEEDGRTNTSIKEAKRLLKCYGGSAWTEHYERDGTMFEVTTITTSGNNSNHRYNHHL